MNILGHIVDFYVTGFREMKLGRTLWAIILVKLFVIFVILKWLFFPDFLKQHATDGDKAGYVSRELTDRRAP